MATALDVLALPAFHDTLVSHLSCELAATALLACSILTRQPVDASLAHQVARKHAPHLPVRIPDGGLEKLIVPELKALHRALRAQRVGKKPKKADYVQAIRTELALRGYPASNKIPFIGLWITLGDRQQARYLVAASRNLTRRLGPPSYVLRKAELALRSRRDFKQWAYMNF